MNWDEFDSEARRLARLIDYKPDIVVGIARGGVIPATLIAKIFDVKDMLVLKLDRTAEKRIVSSYALFDVADKSVLLVEDMIETGRSLIEGKKFLEEHGADVKTACLYTMSISEIKPDYSLGEITAVADFPWNT